MTDARDALHAARRDYNRQHPEAKLPAPPRYLAVVELDGDHMGQHLGGAFRPLTEMHFSDLSSDLRKYGDGTAKLVQDNYGQPVYAGGDEVLALVPRLRAAPLALALQAAFPKNLSGPGTSTASAGITVFHYRHDLRDALRQGRAAIRRAKEYGKENGKECGRECCGISVLKHSGGDLHAVASWEMLQALQTLAGRFEEGVSDRWASQLGQMAPGVHPGAPRAAVEALLRRAVKHGEGCPDDLTHQVLALWQHTWQFRHQRDYKAGGQGSDAPRFWTEAFTAFLDLVGIATFLVRGGE